MSNMASYTWNSVDTLPVTATSLQVAFDRLATWVHEPSDTMWDSEVYQNLLANSNRSVFTPTTRQTLFTKKVVVSKPIKKAVPTNFRDYIKSVKT